MMDTSSLQVSGWSRQGRSRPENGDAWTVHVPSEPIRRERQGSMLAVAEAYDADGSEQPWLARQVLQVFGRRFYQGGGDRAAELLAAGQEANRLVAWQRRAPGRGGLFAGLVAAVATAQEAVLAQVGDGQAFLLRDRRVTPLFPWPRQVPPAEPWRRPPRRMLDTALGAQLHAAVRLNRFSLAPGDQLVLCSGGFSACLPALPGWLALPNPMHMVEAAQDLAGRHNRTVAMLRVPTPAPGPVPMPPAMGETWPAALGGPPNHEALGPEWQALLELLGPVLAALAAAGAALAWATR
ncbi:MAG: PP2C family protein-serine/threonine phosphatase [Anaerolineae bacterium]